MRLACRRARCCYQLAGGHRLGPNGALIAGKDVSLIAGQNLDNVGTLRAANNLSAQAGNDLVNSGLIEAGNRLDLLAVICTSRQGATSTSSPARSMQSATLPWLPRKT